MTAKARDTGAAEWRRRASEGLSGLWSWARANPTTAYGFLLPILAAVKLAAVAGFDTSVAYTILRNDSLATIGGLTLGVIAGVSLLSISVGLGVRLGARIGRSDRWPAKALSNTWFAYVVIVLPLIGGILVYWECVDEACSATTTSVSWYPVFRWGRYWIVLYFFALSYVGTAWSYRRGERFGHVDEADDSPSLMERDRPEHPVGANRQAPSVREEFLSSPGEFLKARAEMLLRPLSYSVAALLVVILLWSWLPEPWHQRETLTMRDGEQFDGYVLEDSGRWMTFLDDESRSIAQIEVESILTRD